MRNKKRVAKNIDIPEGASNEEILKLIEDWWSKGKGFEQIIINGVNTTTNYASYKDDLPAYAIEQWFALTPEKQIKIVRESGSPEKYISRIMGLSIKSNSSPFHSKYRRFNLNMREQYDATTDKKPLWAQDEPTDYSEDLCIKCMKIEIEKFDFYESMLINAMVFNGYKPKKFAEEHNLDVVSVTNNFYALKKRLVKACKNYR